MLSRRKGGFTLIELLVVIAVISLLATIVLVSLNSARAKARDAKRVNDVRQIILALQMYYDANGSFPASTGSDCLGLSSSQTCWQGYESGNDSLNSALSAFLPSIPKDPLYGSRNKGDTYLYAGPGHNVAWHCSGASYPTGPFILWLPDKGTPTSDLADCRALSYYACCGTAMTCSEGWYCAAAIK